MSEANSPDVPHGAPAPSDSLVGGPTSTPLPASPVPPQPQPAPATPASAPRAQEIYVGDRKFASVDDLKTAYIEAQTRSSMVDQLQSVINPASKAAAPNPDKDLADLMYSDPEEYTRQVEDRASKRALSLYQQQQEAIRVRNSFYGKNTDLVGNEDLVEMLYAKMQNELVKLNEGDATSKLANAVRERIASIKGAITAATARELSSGTPVTVGRGSQAPSSAPAPAAPQTMLEQLKSLKKSRAGK